MKAFISRLLLIVVFIVSIQSLYSQVHITEKVNIYPEGMQLKKGEYSLDNVSYKAPYSGSYLGSVCLAARDAAPALGPLTIMFRDSLRDTTMAFNLGEYILFTQQSACSLIVNPPCAQYSEYRYFSFFKSYSSYWTEETGMVYKCFRLPFVLKNDTLKFSYENWIYAPNRDMYNDIQMAINDPLFGCSAYNDGEQELNYCGVDLVPMRFTINAENFLTIGSSTVLHIYPFEKFREYYPLIDDSLMTLEIDSTKYAKFIYDNGTSIDTLESPLDSVKVSDAMGGKVQFFAIGQNPDKPVNVRICARLMSDPSRVFEDTIVVKGSEILLGETKYYYVTEIDGKYIIHEAESPQTPQASLLLPSVQGVVNWDIWGNDPVDSVIIDTTKSGKRAGVYWEKKSPVYDADTLKSKADLPPGMIRLIGRYWHKDSVYIINLKTSAVNPTVALGIEVKKPAKLLRLDPLSSPTFKLSKDVFDNEINIDSICIYYGGIYGIPPHIIKGQMDQEAADTNFGGQIGRGFTPSYRYEPYTTQNDSWIKSKKRNPFYVKESPINDPPIPSHRYVRVINYPYPNKSVWDMIFDCSQLVNVVDDGLHKIYGKRKSDNTMDFSPYDSTIQKRYNEIKDYFISQGIDLPALADSANLNMKDYLENRWIGDAKNIKAQTRIASSYGLLQILYGTAVTKVGYKEDRNHLPEYLNITDTTMKISMEYQKSLLKNALTPEIESGNNWSDGFDVTYWSRVIHIWNNKGWYLKGVKSKSCLYLPQ